MMTFEQRFVEALSILCAGKRPDIQIVKDWFDTKLESFELQAWTIENGPDWAQGVAVINAARLIVSQPPEGEGYETPEDTHRLRFLVTVDVSADVSTLDVSSLGAFTKRHLQLVPFDVAGKLPPADADPTGRPLYPDDIRVVVHRFQGTLG